MPLAESQVETLLTPAEIPVASPGGVYTVTFHQTLSNLGTDAANLVTFTPGHRFKILSLIARTSLVGAGADASQVITTSIGSTAVTGGVLTLTEANQTDSAYGQNVSATAITSLNEGALTDSIVLSVAAAGTEFTDGEIDLLVKVQNLDG